MKQKHRSRLIGLVVLVAVAAAAAITTPTLFGAADEPANEPSAGTQYKLDPVHSSFYFKIKHLNVSYVFGRFNDAHGQYTLGEQPAFQFTIQTKNVDTNTPKRDDDLRSPDFFNVKQYPKITFKSTKVSKSDAGYNVTGELTIHGKTNTITVPLEKVGENKDPWGGYRSGFATEFTLKRSDYGMDHMLDSVGDEVTLMISFEGVRQ